MILFGNTLQCLTVQLWPGNLVTVGKPWRKTIKLYFTRTLIAASLVCAPLASLAAIPPDLDKLPVPSSCRAQFAVIAKLIDARNNGVPQSTILELNKSLSGPSALPSELITGAYQFRQINSDAMQSYVVWSCHAHSHGLPTAPLQEVGTELGECFAKPAPRTCEQELRNEVVGLPRGRIPSAPNMMPVTSGMRPQSPAVAAAIKAPLKGSCVDPVYPVASLRNQEDGTVTLEFKIDAKGNVLDGSVAKRSGFNRLDEAALAALRLCKYEPDVVGGRPVMGLARVVWKWALD